jgi:hypothetical protein
MDGAKPGGRIKQDKIYLNSWMQEAQFMSGISLEKSYSMDDSSTFRQ